MPIGRLRGEFEGAFVHPEAQRFQAPNDGFLSLGKSINRFSPTGAGTLLIRSKARVLFIVPESGAASFVLSLRPGDYTAARTFTVADLGLNTLTATAHGFESGDGPYLLTNSGGALPAGTDTTTKYWLNVVDANTLRLYTSEQAALDGAAAGLVDITGNGTGTHSIGSTIGNANALPTTNITNDFAEARLSISANTLGQVQRVISIVAPHKLTIGLSAAGSVTYWFGA
jgi:hypothetical protein